MGACMYACPAPCPGKTGVLGFENATCTCIKRVRNQRPALVTAFRSVGVQGIMSGENSQFQPVPLHATHGSEELS
eukprot:305822-Pelagomonas_calceolata.AAC.3